MIPKPSTCAGCPYATRSKWFVPDEMIQGATTLVLSQNPGADEEAGRRLTGYDGTARLYEPHPPAPLLGVTGYDLGRKYLPLTGLERGKDVSLANPIRCRPQGINELAEIKSKELRTAIEHCQFHHYRPPESTRLVIAEGAVVVRSLVVSTRYRARSRGRFHCQMVIRMPYGGGVRALEHHTESEEQFYAHIPGLTMVVPSGPRTARALLAAAIRDPDPVIFFEAKALYHAAKEDVPDESETLPLGRARVAREGTDLTLIAYGAMLRVALEAADTLQSEDGASVEVLDLLTISPLDREAIVASVGKTGRAVVVHEAPRSFGPGAEIAASIMDGAFLSLEAPVRRVTAYDVSFVGFAREKATVPDAPRVVAAARETLAF